MHVLPGPCKTTRPVHHSRNERPRNHAILQIPIVDALQSACTFVVIHILPSFRRHLVAVFTLLRR